MATVYNTLKKYISNIKKLFKIIKVKYVVVIIYSEDPRPQILCTGPYVGPIK